MDNLKQSVLKQLRSMLTNNVERKHHCLNLYLVSAADNSLVAEDEFEIYTNHPENKIREKVEKLRTKGGISSLRIIKLERQGEGKYKLELAV